MTVARPGDPDSPSALVADDSVAVRRLVGAVLRRDGYEVREATDGFEAWQEIQARPPALLLVDDVLPGLSGVELVRELRARAELAPVRVAFMVEYPSGLRRAAQAGLGPGAVIRKPFDLHELSSRLRAVASA
jgi:DNA-binding response OmpR family regulator